MKLNNRKIAVIGAGIAGLATARALALRGARPVVLEQSHDLGQVGAGLQITPNGLAVLDALGLGKRVQDAGLALGDVTLCDHRAGSRVLRLNLARKASAGRWLAVPRADLIDVMRLGVERVGAEVRLDARVVSIDTRPEKTILHLADGSRVEAAVVIAADGLHSIGRSTLGSGITPFFTGQVAWRAVIEDDEISAASARVFMAPGRHLVSYPLPGGKRNIVAVEERADWAEESWTTPGDPDQMRDAFSKFGGPVPKWLARVTQAHLWGLFRHEIPARWHGGSLVLVGDAAHPTLPFLAQGANLALEDAWVLADALADAPGVSAALNTFQTLRFERVQRAVRAANANARNYHLRRPLARVAAHTGLRIVDRLAPRAALRRFDWLYRHDVTATAPDAHSHVSVTPLPPLAVAGEAAKPRRTPRPVVPLKKPVFGTRPIKSRLTLRPPESAADGPAVVPADIPAERSAEPPTQMAPPRPIAQPAASKARVKPAAPKPAAAKPAAGKPAAAKPAAKKPATPKPKSPKPAKAKAPATPTTTRKPTKPAARKKS